MPPPPPMQPYVHTHTKAYTHTYCSTHIPLQMVANSSGLKALVLVLLLLRALKMYVFPSTRSERRDGSGVSYKFMFGGEEEGR